MFTDLAFIDWLALVFAAVLLAAASAATVIAVATSSDRRKSLFSFAAHRGSNESAEEVVEVSFDEMMAAADVEKGAKVFKKCSACHKLEDGANGTGPFLYGVVDRPVGSAAGFGYSAAISGLGGDWTAERLSEFLTKPSAFASGTTMSFAGLSKASDRVNLIAYLDTLDD